MTTATPTLEPGAIDISGSTQPGLARLVGVELRKMTDTKAGFWLLVTIAAVTLLINAAMLIWGPDDLGFMDFLSFSGMPQGVLLPVLAVLLVTQEWGQRTGLTTFGLVPHRSKIMVAKLFAAVVFVLAAFAVAIAVALVMTPLSGAADPWNGVDAGTLGRVTLALLIGGIWGYAFGAALLNSAFAIVAYFAVPTVIGIITQIWTSAHDKLLWLDLGTSQGSLFAIDGPTGEQWGQLATGSLLWIVLPIVIGFIRINRAEIK